MNKAVEFPSNQAMPCALLAVLWLVGWTLRVPILAAPPLATRIAETFGLGEAGVGALTMLPVAAVAFGAIPAALLIARFGLRVAIVGGMLLMVLASVARGFVPSVFLLFSASVVMGLGVAVFQTALPGAARVWTPGYAALASAVYLNGMMVGEMAGAGLTLPLVLPMAGGNWQWALALWALPIVAIIIWVAHIRVPSSVSGKPDIAVKPQATLPRWNDSRVWQYGILLASSVVSFYVINAYIGMLLERRGEEHVLETLIFAYNGTPMLGSFVLLAVPQWIGKRLPLMVSALLGFIGLLGFTFFEGWISWLAALLTGFAATIQLILLVSLPAVVATGKAVTRLTAGMTLVGYSIAFVLPFVGGVLAEVTDWTEMVLIPWCF